MAAILDSAALNLYVIDFPIFWILSIYGMSVFCLSIYKFNSS